MKLLVCAATKYGATGEIAQAVADVLAAKGLEVTVIPPEEVGAVEEFDAVVPGSAVYMASGSSPPASCQSARPQPWPPGRSGCFPAVGEPTKAAGNPVDVTKILAATGARDHRIFTGKLARNTSASPTGP